MGRHTDNHIDRLNDEDSNTSNNPDFDSILQARLSRRRLLLGAAGLTALGTASALGLTACGGSDDPAPAPSETLLGFTPVAKSVADAFTVPPGYTAQVLIALGDPLFNGVAAFKNDGTDADYDRRCGEWHDGMEYFGLSATGTRDDASSSRALLGINHEWVTQTFLHPNGPSPAPRPDAEVIKEMQAMGVSIVEIAKGANGRFAYVQGSPFNRRITTETEIELSGPARGSALLHTKFSPDGTRTRGTVNNCGTGKTPWGTLLTGEENWAAFFARNAGDDALRSVKENTAFARYGKSVTATAGSSQAYLWNTAQSGAERFTRWNTSVTGATAADDYRNEFNCQGYITEIDPYSATSVIKKRTALGRMAHESAAVRAVAGKKVAVYMGDDARNEYVYKFVSTQNWDTADANAANRIAVGDKYLDSGKLYAAKFNADGTGNWVELSLANPAVAGYATYAFADEADVLIHARLAADAAGATKMDRPEWGNLNPANGELYITLTNNSNRRTGAVTGSQLNPDPANPRAYSDVRGGITVQSGNVNGHILRIKETGDDPAATTFSWDIFLFGAESDASPTLVNLSGLTDDQDFSSPDGLVFTQSTGLCWIQTDDGALVDESNCMMLAAVPGQVGDGTTVTLNYGTTTVTTRMGKKPTAATLKRFLVGPKDQEITGLAETPDGKVMFVNVQHPGEETPVASVGDPTKYTSHWPGNAGYGAGGANARPRSATVMITKNDGGRIGT
ncbi:MAG TPA: PhoX family phosphatase [Burkholderiaceae bacterium]|nr:PhoX family phosphatase [Burkholderiaceae bacterium]